MKLCAALAVVAFLLVVADVRAQDLKTYHITLENHVFSPAELKIPANEKIKLVVENKDKTPEEFESHDLKREKIITPGGKITLLLGPLAAGTYRYFGEFNEASAKGSIIAE